MTITVPNQWPTRVAARRIAVVGESPGQSELRWHRCPACKRGWDPGKTYSYKCPDCATVGVPSPEPFVGPSGWLLNQLLAEVGIDRAACFVGNVCQHNPPGNEIVRFKWDGPEIQAGLRQLWADLAVFKPHFCLLLGGSALRAFKGHKCSIESWRGSLFWHDQLGCKVVSTYHPAALQRDYSLTAVVRFDVAKAAREARTDELVLPTREIHVLFPG